MSKFDIIFFAGIGIGFACGYGLGHLRGQVVGIEWINKLWDGELR